MVISVAKRVIRGEKLGFTIQDEEKATFTHKFDTKMAWMDAKMKNASLLSNEVRAFRGFPKSRLIIMNKDCIITEVLVVDKEKDRVFNGNYTFGDIILQENGVKIDKKAKKIYLECFDGSILEILSLQPAGKKEMLAAAFVNGYVK